MYVLDTSLSFCSTPLCGQKCMRMRMKDILVGDRDFSCLRDDDRYLYFVHSTISDGQWIVCTLRLCSCLVYMKKGSHFVLLIMICALDVDVAPHTHHNLIEIVHDWSFAPRMWAHSWFFFYLFWWWLLLMIILFFYFLIVRLSLSVTFAIYCHPNFFVWTTKAMALHAHSSQIAYVWVCVGWLVDGFAQ